MLSTRRREKALVGAFSVIVKTDGVFAALIQNEWGWWCRLLVAVRWRGGHKRLINSAPAHEVTTASAADILISASSASREDVMQ